MDARNAAGYDAWVRHAIALVALAAFVLTAAPSSAGAQVASALGDPALARVVPAPEARVDPPEPDPPRRSLGAFYGSGWAGWSIGFGLGTLAGAIAGGIATAPCEHHPDYSCPTVNFSIGIGVGMLTGMVVGAGAGVWAAAERTESGGAPWVAMLGSLLGPAVGAAIGAAIGTTMTGDFAPALSTVIGLQIGTAVLPPLFAALAYELSRL